MALVVAAVSLPTEASASKKAGTKAITVLGGYVNDEACVPLSGGPADETGTFEATCEIGSTYAGGFRGHTLGTLKGRLDVAGNASGVFDETFYGQYVPDGSWGTWRVTGTFTVDGATQVLQGQGRISDGTCGFEGSSGTWRFVGTSFYGSYTAQWTRPLTTPSDPVCALTSAHLR